HTDHNRVTFKIDHQLGTNERLTLGADLMPNKYVNYEAQYPPQINNAECVQQRLYRYRASYSWVLRPDLLFNFRAGFVRGVWDEEANKCLATSYNYGAVAGLTGVLAPYTPNTNIAGISPFGVQYFKFIRIGTHVPINTDLSLTKGPHTVKWGVDFDQQIHSNNTVVN